MATKPVKALFFDLDSTLLDNSRFQDSIKRTCGKIAGTQPGLDAERLLEANNEIWQGYWPEIEHKWTLGTLDGAAVGLESWRRTLRVCGLNDDSLVRLAFQTHQQLECETYRLFDDVRELFILVRRTRIPCALITNGASDTQREKLRILGIEQWFDAVVVSGEIGIAKPDAAAFELALNKLAVLSQYVWHVGDSLTTDVAGAKAAGLTAVWLNRKGLSRNEGDPAPDFEIRSLTNLMDLLIEKAGVM